MKDKSYLQIKMITNNYKTENHQIDSQWLQLIIKDISVGKKIRLCNGELIALGNLDKEILVQLAEGLISLYKITKDLRVLNCALRVSDVVLSEHSSYTASLFEAIQNLLEDL